MRARDHVRVRHVFERALVRVGNAERGQLLAHRFRARGPAVAGARETVDQHRTRRIDAQPDDVHRTRRPRHRNLDAADIAHAERLGGCARFVLARQFVVVGQRPQRHAARMRAARDIGRRKLAVGNGGVTVEVGVHRGLEKVLQSILLQRSKWAQSYLAPPAVPLARSRCPSVCRSATRRIPRSAPPPAPAGRGAPCAPPRR